MSSQNKVKIKLVGSNWSEDMQGKEMVANILQFADKEGTNWYTGQGYEVEVVQEKRQDQDPNANTLVGIIGAIPKSIQVEF